MPATLETPNVGSVAPTGGGEIKIGADGAIPGVPASTTTSPGEKSFQREELFTELAKKAKGVTPTPAETTEPAKKVTPAKKIESPKKAEAPKEPVADQSANEQSEAPKSEAKPAEPTKTAKDKVNPWKLVDDYKARVAEREKEVTDLRKLIPNETQRKAELQEVESLRTRNQELEQEIKYVNFSKSKEFVEQYEKPYKAAWVREMNNLRDIAVQGEDGKTRNVTANDLVQLVNMSPARARQAAKEAYGEYAEDVLQSATKIRDLWESQSSALEKAKQDGEAHFTKTAEESKLARTALEKNVSEAWTQAIAEAQSDERIGVYLKPIEGDADHNQRLSKSQELVDRAFKENPLDPKLSPEERASVVRRHAALRNRAIAYGPLMHKVKTLESELAEANEKLKQYQESTPETAGGQQAKPGTVQLTARQQLESDLAKLAK